MREKRRGPEVPEEKVPVVECFDHFARITSKELASTHSVKSGTLQNACSTRPRVVVGLVKSARTDIARLMNNLVKGPTKNDDKSAAAMLKKNDWHRNKRQPVVNCEQSHERSGRPDMNRDTHHELKRGPNWTSIIKRTTFGLYLSRHEAAEVYSPEEH